MSFFDVYAHRAQKSELCVYDLETDGTVILARFDQVIEAPMWTPDGKALLYNSLGRIYRYDLAEGKIQLVNTGNVIYCNNDHVLAVDGSRIAVSGNVEDSIESKIYIIDFETGMEREVVSTPWSFLHGWSPDKKRLAYCAGRKIGGEIEWDIYTCSADGGPETRLTDAPGLNDGCEFSPDGKTIWFNSVRSGLMQLWRMNSDGTNQMQMTFDEDRNSWFAHISPDMQKVVYLAYSKEDLTPGEHLSDLNVEIRMIPAQGGAPRTLVKLFGGQGTINVNSWNPTSTKFAYVRYEP